MLLAHGLFLGSQVGSASPPEITAFVLPSLSDESIAITTLTWSADATHVQTTESATPPAVGDPNWVAVGSPPTVHMTTAAGGVTVYAYAKGPGGVSSGVPATCAMVMPSLAAWWEPGLGMTVSETSGEDWANSVDTTWSAPQLREQATTNFHQIKSVNVNYVPGPIRRAMSIVSVGGRRISRFRDANTGDNMVLDIVGGTVSAPSGVFWATSVVPAETGFTFSFIWNAGYAPWAAEMRICLDDGTQNYTGDVSKGFDITDISDAQHRCSALADQSGHAYHLAQATAANQMFVQKSDGTSPGGNTFPGKSAVWQPNDVAKTATCTTAGLLTAMAAANTYVARINRLATPTAAVPLFATAGGVALIYGLDTGNKPYITCGTTLTAAAAIDTAAHTVAFGFDPATATATIWVDGVVAAGPTALTPGGTVSPTSVTKTVRRCADRASGVSGVVMSTAQVAAVHAALVAS